MVAEVQAGAVEEAIYYPLDQQSVSVVVAQRVKFGMVVLAVLVESVEVPVAM